jgi:Ca2+-binding EF-hand superfamily protein
MAKKKNHAKIDFIRFVSVFDGLYDEVHKIRNRCIFDLYDVKKQGSLDIMLLMQIFNNIDRNTLFAQEILVLIREYKQKNVLLCEGFTRKITLNF